MLARNPTPGGEMAFFGWSTGNYWDSVDWSWSDMAAQSTKAYGEPVGIATQAGDDCMDAKVRPCQLLGGLLDDARIDEVRR